MKTMKYFPNSSFPVYAKENPSMVKVKFLNLLVFSRYKDPCNHFSPPYSHSKPLRVDSDIC